MTETELRLQAMQLAIKYVEIFPVEDHDLLLTAEAIFEFMNGKNND